MNKIITIQQIKNAGRNYVSNADYNEDKYVEGIVEDKNQRLKLDLDKKRAVRPHGVNVGAKPKRKLKDNKYMAADRRKYNNESIENGHGKLMLAMAEMNKLSTEVMEEIGGEL